MRPECQYEANGEDKPPNLKSEYLKLKTWKNFTVAPEPEAKSQA